ncbi:hypothetical protein [Arthrobacter bambusae]|uniref:hypothetical protein n=1 Tax=Arthrobacter bambusae TaxID=1338426 RepID=UPI0027830B58|nr:hypothetical protein [Arthrobacter bambusae]MDQ0209402.1 hypothetical protein [Arthrobacter bambusae]MDQ0234272.1 hypothetical protein [Arthrobacter bambusae]
MMRWDCKDIDRDAVILELMLEADLADAPELTDSLKALESFASMPAPAPGPALAAMLAGSTPGDGPATTARDSANILPLDELAKRRQLRKHRPAVIGAAVLTAMGLGVGGVAAASGGFSKGTPEFMQTLISGWAPAWTTAPPSLVPPAPAQDSPEVTTNPAPVDLPPSAPPVAGPSADPVAPAPAGTGDAAHQPVAPVAVPAPAGQTSQEQSEVPKHGGPKNDPQGILPQPKTAIPSAPTAKDLQNGVQQAVENAQDDVSVKPAGTSLRWLLGLLSR